MSAQPSPCHYCYRYTPSTPSSSCPLSYFALSCNFQELAKKYPEFHSAWIDLRRGQHQNQRNVSRPQHEENDGMSNGIGTSDGNTCKDEKCTDDSVTSSKSTSQAFSAQVTHTFNAALTRSLLHRHFQIEIPSLPEGRLCPPIPNRSNYVCWLQELLEQSKKDLYRFDNNATPGKDAVDGDAKSLWACQGIDIGTGVSAIYPLLLATELFAGSDACSRKIGKGDDAKIVDEESKCKNNKPRSWKFLATDIDPLAIQSARINVQANHLQDRICVVQVYDTGSTTRTDEKVHKGPLFAAMDEAKKQPTFETCFQQDDESDATPKELAEYPKFDFVMTNPPFYSTLKEATAPRAGDKRSRTDMSANEGVYAPTLHKNASVDMDDSENRETESDGGDVGFVTAIMDDSQYFRHHVTWYTSLIAKRSSLDAILHKLQTLDGVWGNRGQIRTVEFHQGNLDGSSNDGRRGYGSSRVRWGIAWSYERAVGRCSACRVTGGLQSFEVWVNVDDAADKAQRASDEVVSRLTAFFEGLRDIPLKCSKQISEYGNDTIAERKDESGKGPHQSNVGACVTAVEERFFNCNPSSLPVLDHEKDNTNLPYEGHFIADAFVECSGKCNERGHISVDVHLEMYSHTKHGSSIISKIRGPFPGEIGRSNRRWRRLLKRQSTT